MLVQSPSYKNHLRIIQNEIDAEKLKNLQNLNLFNEKTFYQAFVKDMLAAKKEIIIYCPFISKFRSEFFNRAFKTLRHRNINVFIFTRPIEEHDYLMRSEIKCTLKDYEELGACIVYLPGFVHEKAAIIDREILWEGSLNILSQRESKEIMKRTQNEDMAMQIMTYLQLKKPLAEGYKYQYERLCQNLIENSRKNHRLKIRLFFSRFLVPIAKWWLFLGLRVMMLSLKAIKSLAGIINFLHK
jgi:phosphatidylserine/phosphatidylglycerophosphate/cardiolipin synthase-like enzyme